MATLSQLLLSNCYCWLWLHLSLYSMLRTDLLLLLLLSLLLLPPLLLLLLLLLPSLLLLLLLLRTSEDAAADGHVASEGALLVNVVACTRHTSSRGAQGSTM
jgi:hypothetical protein